jgi:hypothetical protein
MKIVALQEASKKVRMFSSEYPPKFINHREQGQVSYLFLPTIAQIPIVQGIFATSFNRY